MNRKKERIKFYKKLKKQSDAFRMFTQTKINDPNWNPSIRPPSSDSSSTSEDSSEATQTKDQSSGKKRVLRVDYSMRDENNSPSNYVKDGDFVVMRFTEIRFFVDQS